MYKINGEIVLIILIIVLLVWLIYSRYHNKNAFFNHAEKFSSQDGVEFMPVGSGDRYGLRGDKLRRSNIDNWYMLPNRQIMLSDSTGEMWQANGTPPSFGIKDCRIVTCPNNGEYDEMDTCWKCGNDCQPKMKIPDLTPHVKI